MNGQTFKDVNGLDVFVPDGSTYTLSQDGRLISIDKLPETNVSTPEIPSLGDMSDVSFGTLPIGIIGGLGSTGYHWNKEKQMWESPDGLRFYTREELPDFEQYLSPADILPVDILPSTTTKQKAGIVLLVALIVLIILWLTK